MSGTTAVGITTKVDWRFINMSIEQVKKEVLYYNGRNITDDEAEEILAFVEDCPGASLSEIISDYYSC